MDYLVRFFGPKSKLDYALKVAGLLLGFVVLYLVQETLLDGFPHEDLWTDIRSVVFLSIPGVCLSLSVLGHVRKLNDELTRIAARDDLTDLPNRRAFMAFAEAHQNGVFIMLDVDHFKTINDSYGHAVGDRCLQEVARFLAGHTPEGGICARLGGEEFGMILTGQTKDEALFLADTLCEGLSFFSDKAEQVIPITLSAGVVALHQDIRIERWLSLADAALYHSKSTGRARATDADKAAAIQARAV